MVTQSGLSTTPHTQAAPNVTREAFLSPLIQREETGLGTPEETPIHPPPLLPWLERNTLTSVETVGQIGPTLFQAASSHGLPDTNALRSKVGGTSSQTAREVKMTGIAIPDCPRNRSETPGKGEGGVS